MQCSRRRAVRRAFLRCLLVVLSVSACITGDAFAQTDAYERWENGISEAWWFSDTAAKDEIAAMQARWASIAEEMRGGAADAWAGDYFVGGETHGSYLRLSTRGGFVLLKVNKCAAQVEDFSYGKVSISPARVQLIPERAMRPHDPNAHAHGRQHTDLDFVPVTFRGDRLLVGESEMTDFGDYVAGLGKFNEHAFIYYVLSTSFFYQMREGETEPSATEAPPASAVPVMPPGYERFLKQPIEGQIVSVGKRSVRRDYSYKSPAGVGEWHASASVTHVNVNVGTMHGAKRGLQLRVLDSDEVVRLTRVGKTSSAGIVIRSLDENRRETYYDHDAQQEKVYPPVAPGWKLSTSPFD
ncbi:MAG TPA: hypothetical protein VGW12_06425 [Pyrinomonadaceae bacterium]|nr:hypothetical protein [Pyrinomonadaceae bacterium]